MNIWLFLSFCTRFGEVEGEEEQGEERVEGDRVAEEGKRVGSEERERRGMRDRGRSRVEPWFNASMFAVNIRKLDRQVDSGRQTEWMKDAYIIKRQLIWNYKNSPPPFRNRRLDFCFRLIYVWYCFQPSKCILRGSHCQKNRRQSLMICQPVPKKSLSEVVCPSDRQTCQQTDENTNLQICVIMVKWLWKVSSTKKRKKDHLIFEFYIDRRSSLR